MTAPPLVSPFRKENVFRARTLTLSRQDIWRPPTVLVRLLLEDSSQVAIMATEKAMDALADVQEGLSYVWRLPGSAVKKSIASLKHGMPENSKEFRLKYPITVSLSDEHLPLSVLSRCVVNFDAIDAMNENDVFSIVGIVSGMPVHQTTPLKEIPFLSVALRAGELETTVRCFLRDFSCAIGDVLAFDGVKLTDHRGVRSKRFSIEGVFTEGGGWK